MAHIPAKRFATVVRLLALTGVVMVACQAVWADPPMSNSAPPPLAEDDGWRRTSHGWEKTRSWEQLATASMQTKGVPNFPVMAIIEPLPSPIPKPLTDLHPTAVALTMLTATALAYHFLPPQRSQT